MIHGLSFLSAFGKVILGNEDWQTAMMDFVTGAFRTALGALAPESGVLTPLPYSVDTWTGTAVLTLPAGTYRVIANGRMAEFTEATPGIDNVPYTLLGDYLSLSCAEYPTVADVDLENVRGFKRWKTALGERLVPSAVVVNGDGLDVAVADHPDFAQADGERPVIVWKVAPSTVSSEAIYSGTLVMLAGVPTVRVPHAFGQALPSTTPADYLVFIPGLTVSRTARPSSTHAQVGRAMPNALPALTCWTGSQRPLNVLNSALLQAGTLRLEAFPASYTDAAKAGKTTIRAEGTSAHIFDLVGRVFDHLTDPSTSAASRFFRFRRNTPGVGTSTDGVTEFRLFPLAGDADTDADVIHLALGGNADLGLLAKKATFNAKTDHALVVTRNADPEAGPTLALLASDGGSQVDETETGKKAVLAVPDLVLLGAGGKTTWKTVPLSAGHPLQAAAADPGDWFLANAGTPRWEPAATAGGERVMFVHLSGTRGRAAVKVRVFIDVTGGSARVLGQVFRWTSGGVTSLSSVVEWTAASGGWKDITLTAPESRDADRDLFLRVSVPNGEDPTGGGLFAVQVQETVFALD